MKFIELLRTAFQSLKTNRKRSFLTIIGIMIGIAAVITILGMGDGVKKTMYDKFGNSKQGQQTTEIGYSSVDMGSTIHGFTEEDIANIKTEFGSEFKDVKIEHDSLINSKMIIGDEEKSVSINLEKKPEKSIDLIAGREITKQDLQMKEPVAMIKESLAKKEFGTAQNAVGTSISSNETTYRIIGVYGGGSKYDQYGTLSAKGTEVVVPYKLYYDGQNANEGDVIKLTFPQDAPASKVSKKIAKYLEKNGSAMNKGTYTYYDMEKELKAFSSQINMITGFISLIAAISLFIAGIGVMNMMYISVSERTQEIGIRLAVGATPTNIMLQFLIEAMVLTVTGGLIGFVLGAGLSHLLAPLLSLGGGIKIKAHVTLNAFLLAFGVSSAVGLIFGILPARQAANKNLIDILR